jgi:hypothetical protein
MTVDLSGLRLLGFIYGGVIAAITVIAFTVVFLHVEGSSLLMPRLLLSQWSNRPSTKPSSVHPATLSEIKRPPIEAASGIAQDDLN